MLSSRVLGGPWLEFGSDALLFLVLSGHEVGFGIELGILGSR